MKYLPFVLGVVQFQFLVVVANSQSLPPISNGKGAMDVFFGDTIHDPYRWLEDDRNPDVEAWVAAHAKQARQFLDTLPGRDALRQRLEELMAYDRMWGFDRVRGTVYYRHQAAGEQHARLMRRRANGIEDTLINPATLSADGTTQLGMWAVSKDGQWLAYAISEAGSDWQEIRVMRLSTKEILPERLRWVKVSGISWHEGGFFYSRYPAPQEGTSALAAKNEYHSVWYHTPGSPQEADRLIYSDPQNPDMFNFCWVVEGTDMLMRSSRVGGSVGTSLYVRSWSNPAQPWTVFFHKDSVSFGIIDVIGDTLYAVTNERAPRKRVIRVVKFRTQWNEETIIPESRDVLESVAYKHGRFLLTYMRDVFHRVLVADNTGRVRDSIKLPTHGAVSGFSARREDSTFLYTFSSYAHPPVTYEYDPRTHQSELWHFAFMPYDARSIRSRQVFATSKDGTRIPMTILSIDGAAAKGPSPTILYGYGGFGITQGPSFNPLLIAWLEKGGTYAIANIRGGGEYGEDWHRAGTTTRKQNVFDDFIACAEWLITNNITTKGALAINGRSNGGLLVGAVMTQRPDLFAAAIPEVGVLDMLRYHLFTIGWNWRSDYGSVDAEAEYRALRAYSPYHNLQPGVEYPATLVMTADHDDRVVPAHSFKFYARLREVYGGPRPMLMRVETRSGHGAVNLGVMLDNVADKWAFAWAACTGRFAGR